jgi:O-antigen ligase
MTIGVFYLVGQFMVVYQSMDPSQIRRINSTFALLEGRLEGGSANERFELLQISFKQIRERPLLGNGIGSFHRLKGYGLGSHNTFLMILGETGIFVLVLFVSIFIVLAFYGYHLQDFSSKVFILTTLFVLVLTVLMTSHQGVYYRVGNVLIAFSMGIVYFKEV